MNHDIDRYLERLLAENARLRDIIERCGLSVENIDERDLAQYPLERALRRIKELERRQSEATRILEGGK